MISLNISAERSGKDEIPTHGEDCNVNNKIYIGDVKHMINKYTRLYGDIDYDKAMLAMDTLIVYFATTEMYRISVNVNQREYSASPKKKMTKTEIEKELGYPIEIVKGE